MSLYLDLENENTFNDLNNENIFTRFQFVLSDPEDHMKKRCIKCI